MKYRVGFYLSVILVASATAILVLILTKVVSIVDAGALALSLLALIVSILSSFKDEIFPFRLSVFSDTIFLVAGKAIPPSTGVTVQVLLPITFFNRGYSEGVIQTVRLMVKPEHSDLKSEFLPAIEIDMTAFTQQLKGINASNSLGTFVGFLIESKKAIKKNIVFTPRTEPSIPVFVWQPGVYHFELYIQIHGDKRLRKYLDMEQKIDNNSLTMLATGKVNALFYYSDAKI